MQTKTASTAATTQVLVIRAFIEFNMDAHWRVGRTRKKPLFQLGMPVVSLIPRAKDEGREMTDIQFQAISYCSCSQEQL